MIPLPDDLCDSLNRESRSDGEPEVQQAAIEPLVRAKKRGGMICVEQRGIIF